MEQHPVPQNITGFQFKLIGDMTIKQFAYLAGGLIIAYLITLLPWPQIFKAPLAAIVALLGFSLAFVPIEERPLDRWFVAFFKAVYSPTEYVWKKIPPVMDWLVVTNANMVPQIPAEEIMKVDNKLNDYLKTLPNLPQTPIDKSENSFLKTLDFTIGSNIVPSQIPPFYSPPPQEEKEEEQPPLPKVRVRKLKASLKGEIIFPPKETDKKNMDIELPKPSLPEEKPSEEVKKTEPSPQVIQEVVSSSDVFIDNKNRSTIISPPPVIKDVVPEEKKVAKEEPLPKEAREEARRLKSQNEMLNAQLKKFQEQIEALQQFAVQTSEGKIRLKEMLSKYEEAERQKERALQELTNLKRKAQGDTRQIVTPSEQAAPKETPRVQFVSPTTAKKEGSPFAPQSPNVIAGIITDKNGEIIPGVIITVKDVQENPLRALKSNQLGQFKTGTPLANGSYTIDLEKEGFNFDIIAIEAKGDNIPLLEIKAK